MTERIQQIAERIREVRENSGLTPQEVADELQIQVSVYSQYETAEADIPISVLYEMARIFNVDLTDLLTGSSPKLHSYCLVKKGEGIEIERYPGYKFESLAYNFINKKVEPLLVFIEPEENKKMSLVTHAGQEFNYCLEGKIKVILGGQEIQLNPGDSLYFDPAIPHGQMAANGQTAKFLTVILHDS
jgi:transcriptional regulator with XRE-family HTH domain